MTRTAHLTIAAVAVAGVAVVTGLGVAATSAAATSIAASSTSSVVLHLTEHRVQESQLDLGPKGPSAGDELLLAGVLTAPGGRTAGEDSGVCTVTAFDQHRQDAVCSVALQLTGGQLLISGQESLSSTNQLFAITGGTGAYRHAHGQLTVRQTNPTTRQVTIDLR